MKFSLLLEAKLRTMLLQSLLQPQLCRPPLLPRKLLKWQPQPGAAAVAFLGAGAEEAEIIVVAAVVITPTIKTIIKTTAAKIINVKIKTQIILPTNPTQNLINEALVTLTGPQIQVVLVTGPKVVRRPTVVIR